VQSEHDVRLGVAADPHRFSESALGQRAGRRGQSGSRVHILKLFKTCALTDVHTGYVIKLIGGREGTPMNPTRRAFFKIGAGGVISSILGFDLKPAYAQSAGLKISRTTETRSTCPYCSVSCGVIIHTLGDKAKNVTPQVIHVEGDPDHPINRGTLCPKGASLQQDILNER